MPSSHRDHSSDGEIVFTTQTFEMLDTGIGKEAGYKDDKELIAAAEAERAAMDPEVREALEQLDRYVERKVLGL